MSTIGAPTRSLSVGLTAWQRAGKRGFDVAVAMAVLVGLGWLIPPLALLARWSTGGSGILRQTRVGRHGRPFTILKLRTMRATHDGPTVTTEDDARLTRFGQWLRRLELDELPQFANVLLGDMSLVGPRPDVPGFADLLTGPDRVVLSVRPGITGPATLVYRHEEYELGRHDEPERHNVEVIWPAKVQINRRYVERWCWRADVRYLWLTLRRDTLSLDEALP
ncbi:MAG: sugar transferase [Acidimicrobiales bacterium]